MSNEMRYSPDLLGATKESTYYALTMFPYPSGSGLHCGHASVFTINDVIARYKRMQGFTVLNPFGFDAFGLPTENYAIQQGKPAREVTDINKKHFLNQVDALNMSFDMSRVIDTSEPEYYKRTQRIFSKLYEVGLAYKDTLWVNRCPSCMTVLANDQVVDGKCERCKSEIIQKKHPQWFIKITDYADRLISDLDDLDRPEETKIAQKNRIGRSEGAEIDFMVVQGEKKEMITCFTTRPDTIYGVTALVLAPENTLLDELLNEKRKQMVEGYRQSTLAKTSVQRQKDLKEKTGIDSGLFALHPLTNEQLPIWYADYVLADYGSGAVMSVPAHDERDNEFAKKFGLEIKQVILLKGAVDGFYLVEEGKNMPDHGYQAHETKKGFVGRYTTQVSYKGDEDSVLFNSGEFDDLTIVDGKKKIITHLESLGSGRKKITYKLRDRSVSRQRYRGSPVPIWYDEEGKDHLVPEAELPVILPLDLEDYKPTGKSPLEDHPDFPCYGGQNVPYYKFNSDAGDRAFKEGEEVVNKKAARCLVKDLSTGKYLVLYRVHQGVYVEPGGGIEFGETIKDACMREVYEETGLKNIKNVKLIDLFVLDFRHNVRGRNQRNDQYYFYAEVESAEFDNISKQDHEDFKISRMELDDIIKLKDFQKPVQYVIKKLMGSNIEWDGDYIERKNTRECDTLDTFMCSSFYFLRFPDANNSDELIRKELAQKMFPVDFYSGGKEHTVGHLLYSRFIHKFLFDQGFVETSEPFTKLIHQGMVLGADGRKMGKRYNNGVDPLVVVDTYGADAVRTYLMFMGPVEADKPWSDTSLNGVAKFLKRVETLLHSEFRGKMNEDIESLLHETIKGITYDIENLKLNTCVSKLMILVNAIYEKKAITDTQLKTLAQLLAPFATELAEKIWGELGGSGDVHFSSWPICDESKIVQGSITLPIQINGKVRAKIDIAPGLTEDEVVLLAKSQENIAKRIEGKDIKKIIWVQDKILNLIIG